MAAALIPTGHESIMSDTPSASISHDDTIAAQETPASSEDLLHEGQLIADRYQIEQRIGEGGMGSVYKAKHVNMGSEVALKVLHRELARDEEYTQRFRREAQAASAIRHPNICSATDFGELPSGAPYMVMEFLDGETLEALMQREVVIPVPEALHIVNQIVSVLQEAHAHGIVHRDLKPENIMLVTRAGSAGVVKVMDFGIASIQDGQRLAPETRITRAGIAYGTPAYMSPEQVSGETDIDGRADIYSLGIMMFEMLTGTPPFQGNNVAAIMAQHLTAPAPSLRATHPSAQIPEALEVIVLKMLEKEPDARHADADELAKELLALTPHVTGTHPSLAAQSAQFPIAQPAPLDSSSKRLILLAIPLVGLLLVALVGVMFVALTQPEPAEQAIEVDESSPPEVVKQSIEVSRRQFVAQNEGLNELVVQMAAGEQKQALEALQAREQELGDSPHYHYYVALAHDGSKQPKLAAEHYLQAIAGDERYVQDEQIISHFSSLATSSRDALSKLLDDALSTHPKLVDPVLSRVAQKALDPELKRKTRKQIVDLLAEHDYMAKLPIWQAATIELESERKCDERIAAIKKLGETQAPEALATLKRWDKKPRTGCKGSTLISKLQKDQDCYACLRAPLAKAIKAHTAEK